MRVLGLAILSVLRVSSAAGSASDSCAEETSLIQGGLREVKRVDRHQVVAEEKVVSEETGFVRGPPVKGTGDAVYILDGEKRWITSPDSFFSYFQSWGDVKILPDDLINAIPQSDQNVEARGDGPMLSGSESVPFKGGPDAVYVFSGTKRHIPNPTIYFQYYQEWSDFRLVDDAWLDQIPAGPSIAPLLVRGDADGSCPAGNVRVTAEDCAGTDGHSLSDGTALSNSHHRTDCDGHFTPGAGCFVNVHGNVYSTASECAEAQTQSPFWDNHHQAICTPITELVRGGSDGSCPAGTSRVTPEDCPQVNGLSLSDGTALSNSRHRTDCAGHFVHGEGCFVNVNGNVYSTAPSCDVANAHGQPYWTNKHHAVCAGRAGV